MIRRVITMLLSTKWNAIVVAFLFLALAAPAWAQNPASNKAFWGSRTDALTLASVRGGQSAEVILFDIPAAIKTSQGGAMSAILSLESVLWTNNLTTAIVGGGKSSSSSRAAIKAWIEIDGHPMLPGVVVYADRLQATGLTANLACDVQGNITPLTCTVTGDVTLELFQATKTANTFVFFLGPLGAQIHSVRAKAQGMIECRDSKGDVITCPSTTLAGFENASTMAAIGKASLLVEEQQNWGAR